MTSESNPQIPSLFEQRLAEMTPGDRLRLQAAMLDQQEEMEERQRRSEGPAGRRRTLKRRTS